MVAELETKVMKFAVVSRLVVCLLLVLAGFLPHHAADLFSPPAAANASSLDRWLLRRLSGFSQWDSRYFLLVSEHGYAVEQSLVFLPLLPLLCRGLACLLSPLGVALQLRLLLSGVLLNNLLFVVSARTLYRLSCRVLGDNSLAYTAALVFCLSPASVFFSVLYTESLFFLLVVAGLLAWVERRSFAAALLFALAAACRSNALLLAVFPPAAALAACAAHRRRAPSPAVLLISCVFSLVSAALSVACIVAGFLLTQAFAFHRFCAPLPLFSLLPAAPPPPALRRFAAEKGYRTSDSPPPAWCAHRPPLSYSAIQAAHWEVGFLRYFQLKQLPNFLLATPVLLLSAAAVAGFQRRYPGVLTTLGASEVALGGVADGRERRAVRQATPFLLHLSAVVALLFPTIHVQVLTRLILSSSPVAYWAIAKLLLDRIFLHESAGDWEVFARVRKREARCAEVLTEVRRSGNLLLDKMAAFPRLSTTRRLLVVYLVTYSLVGTLLHGVCLPWT